MGTPNSEAKSLALSSDDVVRIIEASAKCGVGVLKFQDLMVSFGKQVEPEVVLPGNPANNSASMVEAPTEQQLQTQGQNALEKSELELREEQLSELAITNPLEFERLINQGELEDDTDIDGDDPTE